MFCTKCGRVLQDGEICNCQSQKQKIFVDEPGEISFNFDIDKVKNNVNKVVSNVGAAAKDTDVNIFERGKKIVPECILANDGEVPIKQYDFAKLQSVFSLSFAECRLQITNKRLLLRATGKSITGKTVLQEEFKIDELAGFDIKKRPRFSFAHLLLLILLSCIGVLGYGIGGIFGNSDVLGLIVAIIIFVGGIAAYVFTELKLNKMKSYKNFYAIKQIAISIVLGIILGCLNRYQNESVIMVLSAPIAILWLINSIHLIFAPSLTAIIKTKGGSSGLELKRKEFSLLTLNSEENSGFSQVMPWKDTDLVIKEICTIIDDLQTIGDSAIHKWQKQS